MIRDVIYIRPLRMVGFPTRERLRASPTKPSYLTPYPSYLGAPHPDFIPYFSTCSNRLIIFDPLYSNHLYFINIR